MKFGKYILAALAAAVVSHFAFVQAVPLVLMNAAISRVGGGQPNQWRLGARVTPASRAIVRPAPDFAYSSCAFDLSRGPVIIHVAPWDAYWSLSLYAANSDNFYVIDDREARDGATITLARQAPRDAGEEGQPTTVISPSVRGIALIRRLAPTADAYAAVSQVAAGDICAAAQ